MHLCQSAVVPHLIVYNSNEWYNLNLTLAPLISRMMA